MISYSQKAALRFQLFSQSPRVMLWDNYHAFWKGNLMLLKTNKLMLWDEYCLKWYLRLSTTPRAVVIKICQMSVFKVKVKKSYKCMQSNQIRKVSKSSFYTSIKISFSLQILQDCLIIFLKRSLHLKSTWTTSSAASPFLKHGSWGLSHLTSATDTDYWETKMNTDMSYSTELELNFVTRGV